MRDCMWGEKRSLVTTWDALEPVWITIARGGAAGHSVATFRGRRAAA